MILVDLTQKFEKKSGSGSRRDFVFFFLPGAPRAPLPPLPRLEGSVELPYGLPPTQKII